jgi:predicted nucleic acid-binding protein
LSEHNSTIDTSTLLSLRCAGVLGAISLLFSRILVPRAVWAELAKGGLKNEAIESVLAEYGFFERCADYDRSRVQLLLDTRESRKEGRDEGEAEAVIQAQERSCGMVLVDDSLGRSWAVRHGLECHGTLWVLQELRRRGILRTLRPHFEALIRGHRRQPLEAMNKILAEFAEPPISADEEELLEKPGE